MTREHPQPYLQYEPGETDWLLINWLTRMRHDGDIEHTLSKAINGPSNFLQFFRYRPLLYTLDSLGNIDRAAWVEPTMGSVFLAFWLAPERRFFDRESLCFFFDTIQRVFDEGANSLAGFIKERATPQITDAFIRQHERIGYSYCGRLPKFFDGADAHLVAMTAAEWEVQDGRARQWWRQRRDGHGAIDLAASHIQRTNGLAKRRHRRDREVADGFPERESADWWGEFGAFAFADTDH